MVSSDKQAGAQPQIPNDQAIALMVVVGDDHQVFLDALSVVLGQHNFAVSLARTLPEIIDAVACRHVVVDVPKAAGARRTAPARRHAPAGRVPGRP